MADETVADYDVRSPASRTFLTVLGTILAIVLIGGMVLGASILKRDTRISTSDVELDDSALLVIDAGDADVRLVEGEEGIVRIRARITSGLRKTDYQLGRRGDEIKIISACQTWLSPGCGVSATVEVPKGLPIVVKTDSGDVAADAITEGVLKVVSGSGDISVSDLSVDELDVDTRSGTITASFATQPFGFKAITESGDIRATLPTGKRTYVVDATSKSGKVNSSFPSDDEGEGFVRVTSGSGNVDLRSE